MCDGKNLFRAIVLVPVWLLTLLLKPFLRDNHPWKHPSLTLRSWCARGTDSAVQFGIAFWVLGLCQITLFVQFYILCQK